MFAVIKLFSIYLTAAALWDEVCATHVLPMGVGPLLRSSIKGTELPLPKYWYYSKGNWLRYNFAAIRTCRRFDTIPACDRQTDRRTDGRNCYS